ncbi:hypothetical protein K0M31_018383 [Melipona bicolor]|uniref:Uncharacterized protein n=1 Tax=Melipona bicolor TaxID=60889 RepID=A0AA40G3Y9_9HYME|nr:hypothetical protein K0M31_018383 [Melipona bicolor]
MHTGRHEPFQLHTSATTPPSPSNKLLDIPLTQPSVYVRYYRSFGFPCYLGIGCHESKAFSQRVPLGKRETPYRGIPTPLKYGGIRTIRICLPSTLAITRKLSLHPNASIGEAHEERRSSISCHFT